MSQILLRKKGDQLIITHFYKSPTDVYNPDPEDDFSEEDLQELIDGLVEGDEWYRKVSNLPNDPFSDAWEFNEENSTVGTNFDKAKELVHGNRRAAREREFRPFDMKIAAQVPGAAESAEAERVEIREKYYGIQDEIDLCENIEQLKAFNIG